MKDENGITSVPKGTKILALDENRLLVSEGDWPIGASQIIDFGATYVEPHGITTSGEIVYANRGFKYADKDVKWAFAE